MASAGFVQANGVELCYESMGDPDDPALLLVMGLGVQLIDWEPAFCQNLVDRGFHVIRYDHRDTGLSTRFDANVPDVAAARNGDYSSAAYTLGDMADDGIGLLDALGIEQAHVVGASMGGMIAQLMAIRHQSRVLSLCSIMSTTGAKDVGRAREDALAAILATPAVTRDEVVAASAALGRIITGGGYPFDEAMLTRRAGAAYDRAYYPVGKARQQVAIIAAEDRTPALAGLTVPTVVIHGANDPLVTPSGGEATAAAVPGAKLVLIPGMGHEIPEGARPLIVAEIAANAARAGMRAQV